MQAVLRQHVPHTAPDPFRADIYYEEVRLHSSEDPIQGPYVMPLVTLRTNPCRWSARAGCVMCGYHLGANRDPVTDEHLLAQTEDAIRRLNPNVYPALVFTSNGSFLDRAEVSDEVRPKLLERLREAGFRFLVVETRPEYITPERLRDMGRAFSPGDHAGRLPISVSFGLESVNDFIQQYCINKGRRREDYVEAFDLLRAECFSYDCYVLLGKPFLTAQEDVADAIETIRFAVDHGSEYCFVMVTNLVDYGLTGYLHDRGRYRLPSLWRAVKLLEQLPDRYRRAVQIKGISHAPVPPLRYARSCELCTEHVKGSINFWNQTGEFEHIRAIHPCGCRDQFRRDEWGQVDRLPVPERVLHEYQRLAAELGVDPQELPSREQLYARWSG
jgi:radical SAM enzyme (TIGR01210 family)